jgi:hypothetical protein
LPCHRFDDEGCHLLCGERLLERGKVVEPDRRAVADERTEPFAEGPVAAQRQGAVRQAVEGVLAMDDPTSTGCRAAELDRRLGRLGAGVAEERFTQPRHAREQLLGEEAREQRGVELDEASELATQHLLERPDHGRVVAAEREHAKAAQKVEIALPPGVEQIGALRTDVVDVEPEHSQNPQGLGVEMLLEQSELFRPALGDQRPQIERHDAFPPRSPRAHWNARPNRLDPQETVARRAPLIGPGPRSLRRRGFLGRRPAFAAGDVAGSTANDNGFRGRLDSRVGARKLAFLRNRLLRRLLQIAAPETPAGLVAAFRDLRAEQGAPAQRIR